MREGLTPSEIWRRHWGYSGVKGEQAGADTKLQRGRGGNECEHRKAARRREAGQRPENAHSWRKPQHQGLHRLLRHAGNPLVLVALLSTRVAAPCCPLQEWFRDRNRDRQSKACPRTAIRRDGLKLQMEMWLLGSIGRGCNLRQGPLLQRVRPKNTGKPEEIHIKKNNGELISRLEPTRALPPTDVTTPLLVIAPPSKNYFGNEVSCHTREVSRVMLAHSVSLGLYQLVCSVLWPLKQESDVQHKA